MEQIYLYTDGACSYNPGPGGWGAIIIYPGDRRVELSGFEPQTTNNRMELTAVIKGMRAIERNDLPVTICSDSRYVVDAINAKWIDSWQKRNWHNANKEPVANQDLWQEILELNKKLNPKYVWVKGHSTNEINNRCDALAVQAIKDHE